VARIIAVVLVLVTAGAGRVARAGDGAAPVYPIEIGARGSASSIELAGPGGSVDCGARCATNLRAGRYRLVVWDTEGHRWAERLEVSGPIRATVTPGSYRARIGGWALYTLGWAGVAIGGGMVLTGFVGHALEGADCGLRCNYDEVNETRWYIAGAITIAASIGVTVIGWIMRHGKGAATLTTF
jgi:hypothetical protein